MTPCHESMLPASAAGHVIIHMHTHILYRDRQHWNLEVPLNLRSTWLGVTQFKIWISWANLYLLCIDFCLEFLVNVLFPFYVVWLFHHNPIATNEFDTQITTIDSMKRSQLAPWKSAVTQICQGVGLICYCCITCRLFW